MEPVREVHVTSLEMTPDLSTSALRLTANVAGATAGQRVEATAYDGKRKVGTVTGAPNQELTLSIPNAKLWSPDSPFLYDLRVRVLDGDEQDRKSVV